MSTMLRARVERALTPPHPGDILPWLAYAYVIDHNGYAVVIDDRFMVLDAMAGSQPEAMQAAYKLLADLDRELTDEVHASRATRRKATR